MYSEQIANNVKKDGDLIIKLTQLEVEYYSKKNNLIKDWIKKNAVYEKGQFIRCVLGIIKINTITWNVINGQYRIRYVGKRYRQAGNELFPVKSKYNTGEFPEDESNLIDVTNMIIHKKNE